MAASGARKKNKTSLVMKTGLSTAVVALLLFSASTVLSAIHLKKTINAGFQREMETVASLVPETLSGPLFDYNFERVEDLAENLFSNIIIAGIVVSDESGNAIAEFIDDAVDESLLIVKELPVNTFNRMDEEITVGTVQISFSAESSKNYAQNAIKGSLIQNIVILLALVVFNSLVLRSVAVKPIKITSAKMEEIASGDADLTNKIAIRSSDEIGELSRFFNEFLSNLESLVVDIRSSLDAALDIQGDLGANTDETVSSLAQMESNIDSTKKQMEILEESIRKSQDVVSGIIHQIERTIDNVESQGALVEQTSASVSELLASIDNVAAITKKEKESTQALVVTAKDGGERLRRTTDVISRVEQSIEQIRDFLQIINDIAAQTNLLAMNAAIEAAHAGEAGRGFAVVADEIRKLAEESGTGANDIGSVLEEVIKNIQNAAVLSRDTIQSFSEIDSEIGNATDSFEEISSAMAEMNAGSHEIHDAVGNLTDVSQELVKDAQGMKRGSSDLDESMNRITDVSSVVVSATTEIRQGIHEINRAIGHVSELSGALGNNARDLDSKISRFKTSEGQATAEPSEGSS